jgi:hypothetical protein
MNLHLVKGGTPLSNDSELSSTHLKRRLMNEIMSLYMQCNKVTIVKEGDCDMIHVTHNNHKYVFKITSLYPFHPPIEITIDGMRLKIAVNITENRFVPYLNKFYKGFCACCMSVLGNSSLWGPAMRITHLINETEMIIRMKKEILLRVLCDAIRDKYSCLTDFAPFESYLF